MNLQNSTLMKIVITAVGLALFLLSTVGFAIWRNNHPAYPISASEIEKSADLGIAWLLANREKILQDDNAVLWWMVGESAAFLNDGRLRELFYAYQARLDRKYPLSVWHHLFDPESRVPVDGSLLATLPDYNRHFIYGLTCDTELAKLQVIKDQNKTDFCSHTHPLSPACLTHQMMSFRFMQRRGCGNQDEVGRALSTLSHNVETQAALDFRVVDVYLQRVLMLADAGAWDRINTRWIRKILDAQTGDGGWSGFYPLIKTGTNTYFGFSGRGFSIRRPLSNFHATVQGVLLMGLLKRHLNGSPTLAITGG